MTADTKTKSLPLGLQDLGKPSLTALSYALRHPDTWPKGFVWDYGECDQCAMGLAAHLWAEIQFPDDDPDYKAAVSIMARDFALSYSAAKSIFFGGDWTPTKTTKRGWLFPQWKSQWNFDAVTPEMVADQIDKYLKDVE